MTRLRIAATAIIVAGSISGVVHAQVACPPTVSVEQKASAPNDWSLGYSKDAAELSSVTIFDGSPEELASLKYDDERTVKDEIVQTWELPASPRGYWIVCGYANTTAQLRRKLPDRVRACEVVFEKGVSYAGGGAVIKLARCTSAATTH